MALSRRTPQTADRGTPELPFQQLLRSAITLRFVYMYVLPKTALTQCLSDTTAALEAGALKPRIAARLPHT